MLKPALLSDCTTNAMSYGRIIGASIRTAACGQANSHQATSNNHHQFPSVARTFSTPAPIASISELNRHQSHRSGVHLLINLHLIARRSSSRSSPSQSTCRRNNPKDPAEAATGYGVSIVSIDKSGITTWSETRHLCRVVGHSRDVRREGQAARHPHSRRPDAPMAAGRRLMDESTNKKLSKIQFDTQTSK